MELAEQSDVREHPYLLCLSCHKRLLSAALRPMEFFNLAAIHGNSALLHDGLYDDRTGEALQPDVDVPDVEQFPFPVFDDIKNDLNMLIDFAFVQLFTDEKVIDQLRLFNKGDVLHRIAEKVRYSPAIDYKAYEITAKVVGNRASEWIRAEWNSSRNEGLLVIAEALASCLDFEEAFSIMTTALERGDKKYLTVNVSSLCYLNSERVLDWIETNIVRIHDVSADWGHLAASSKFTWQRADKWLSMRRPLSLVALDALIYCTTVGDRQNQSLWMRKLNPDIPDRPTADIISNRLYEYLKSDNVPRTGNAVLAIIENLLVKMA